MSLEQLMTMPVTISHPMQITNRYGDTAFDHQWGDDTEDTLAWISQRNAAENLDGRDEQRSEWIGYFPVGTCLAARDRVVRGDTVFEVTGPPNVAETPSGGPHHVEADLRVVEG